MALWKDQVTPVKEPPPAPVVPAPIATIETIPKKEFEPRIDTQPTYTAPVRDMDQKQKESIITDDLTIEGKIEGSGHVRIAGKFKGDVNVQGNLVIEQGANVTGSVRAKHVIISGQLEGNIEAATRVELHETGVLIGDVTADALTVAAGSRMRGKADFGWMDKDKATRVP